MTVTAEAVPSKAQGFRSSGLRRSVELLADGLRLTLDPDGAVRALDSLTEGRAIFGFEQLWFYKVQAGIVVQAPRPDWLVRLSPRRARIYGRAFDCEVAQSMDFFPGQSRGFVRRVGIRNAGQGKVRMRVFELVDPTNAHFSGGRWGSLGVNAFNRESHVAMDEVSDPPSARVVGASPSPSKLYMTTNRARAQELLSAGDLPDPTAGMSGQVLVVSSHEFDLYPGESRELVFISLYSPGKLEDVLADFGRLQSGEKQRSSPGPDFACSDQSISEAASWAVPAAKSGAHSGDLLERYEVLRALSYLDPKLFSEAVAEAKAALRKDGSLPHAMDRSRPGILETAVFVRAAAVFASVSQDKKLARTGYPAIKKMASSLLASSKDNAVITDAGLPQGWRRRLGRGYPTGEIPEVSLAVADALEQAAQVARMVSKPGDAGRFLERSKLITDRVRKSLVDERGCLSLCRESSGRLRTDETVDMAVAAFRHEFMASAEQAAVHRLLEKDFDTPYGPRCVPTSNSVYFNSSYGDGQLGGTWPRAALAQTLLCYRSGLAGIGALSLGKSARLVSEDALKLGGVPGAFPEWIDVETREARGGDTDPVAAARFLEVLLLGELGLPEAAERASVVPAQGSTLGWLMVSDFWAGDRSSVFLGRCAGKPHVFFSGAKLESKAGARFARAERIEAPHRGATGISFDTPGQVICLGNSLPSSARFAVAFPPRAAELTRRLSTPLEEYDPTKGTWAKTGSVRVSTTMSFDASLEPNGWKAYRISTP